MNKYKIGKDFILVVIKSADKYPPWGQMRSMSLNMSPDMWHGRGDMLIGMTCQGMGGMHLIHGGTQSSGSGCRNRTWRTRPWCGVSGLSGDTSQTYHPQPVGVSRHTLANTMVAAGNGQHNGCGAKITSTNTLFYHFTDTKRNASPDRGIVLLTQRLWRQIVPSS